MPERKEEALNDLEALGGADRNPGLYRGQHRRLGPGPALRGGRTCPAVYGGEESRQRPPARRQGAGKMPRRPTRSGKERQGRRREQEQTEGGRAGRSRG